MSHCVPFSLSDGQSDLRASLPHPLLTLHALGVCPQMSDTFSHGFPHQDVPSAATFQCPRLRCNTVISVVDVAVMDVDAARVFAGGDPISVVRFHFASVVPLTGDVEPCEFDPLEQTSLSLSTSTWREQNYYADSNDSTDGRVL